MAKGRIDFFSGVKGSRSKGMCLHQLSDILFIALCTLLSNGEDFEDMIEFAKQRIDWLEAKISLSNEIPSHDTFNWALQMIDTESFSEVLKKDGGVLLKHVEGKLICLDGKKYEVYLQKIEVIKTLVEIESTRKIKDVKSIETRYYISSDEGKSADEYNEMESGHWGIENHFHWHLDVTFKEGRRRSRKGNASQNLNILRKMALHRIAKDDSKISKKKRRFRASMNLDYLEDILKL